MGAVKTMLVFDVVGAPLALATRSLLAKTMSTGDFGLYSVIYGLVMLLGSLAAPDIAFTTFIASARAAGRRAEVRSWALYGLACGVVAGIAVASALAAAAHLLAQRWLHTDLATGHLLVASLGLATMTLTFNASGILAGLDRFGLSGGLQLSRQAGFLALAGVSLLLLRRSDLIYWALSISAAAVASIAALLVTRSVRAYSAEGRGGWRDEVPARTRAVLRYYAPLLAKSLGSQLTDKFGLFSIAAVLPLSAAGAYGAVTPLATLAVVASRWTHGPLATHFAERHSARDAESSDWLLWRSTGLSAVFSCLVALGAAIMARVLISVLYTADYLVAADAFVLLLLAAAVGGLSGPAVRSLLAAARTRMVAVISIVSGVTYAVLAYVAARAAGLMGVAAASVLVLSCQSLAHLWASVSGRPARLRYLWVAGPLVTAVGLYLAARLAFGQLGWLGQIAVAAVACIAYLCLMMATPLISAGDIRYLLKTFFIPKSGRGGGK